MPASSSMEVCTTVQAGSWHTIVMVSDSLFSLWFSEGLVERLPVYAHTCTHTQTGRLCLCVGELPAEHFQTTKPFDCILGVERSMHWPSRGIQ